MGSMVVDVACIPVSVAQEENLWAAAGEIFSSNVDGLGVTARIWRIDVPYSVKTPGVPVFARYEPESSDAVVDTRIGPYLERLQESGIGKADSDLEELYWSWSADGTPRFLGVFTWRLDIPAKYASRAPSYLRITGTEEDYAQAEKRVTDCLRNEVALSQDIELELFKERPKCVEGAAWTPIFRCYRG